jgi:hypothetical protein
LVGREKKMRIVWVGATLISLTVLGQISGATETRQALLEQAEKARDAEDHPRALSLAIRAGDIRMSPSLRRFIAEEQYAVGQLADATRSAEGCVQEATAAKALNNRRPILRACKSLIEELQRSAARIIVLMPDPIPPETEVLIGGQTLPESLYGSPYLCRSGEIHLEAKAPGRVPFQRDLVVGPQQEATVNVLLLPQLEVPEPKAVSVPTVVPDTKPVSDGRVVSAAPVSAAPVIQAGPEKPSTAQIGPYVVLGTGAVSLGASVVFLIVRNNAIHTLKSQCVQGPANLTTCPDTPEAHSLQKKASTYNALTNVAVGVGGAALVGGAIWLFSDRAHNSGARPRAEVQITPIHGGAMLGIAGAL